MRFQCGKFLIAGLPVAIKQAKPLYTAKGWRFAHSPKGESEGIAQEMFCTKRTFWLTFKQFQPDMHGRGFKPDMVVG